MWCSPEMRFGITFRRRLSRREGRPDQFTDFAAKTEAFVVQELQNKLKVPVVAALGNNDSPCGDYQIPPNSPFLAALANELTVLSGSPEAKSTFALGGFFSMAHPTIANQDIHCSEHDFLVELRIRVAPMRWPDNGDPGEAELEWLGWKLYKDSLLHRGVTLVMHIPPGMDAYDSSHAQCRSPVSFWQDKYRTNSTLW